MKRNIAILEDGSESKHSVQIDSHFDKDHVKLFFNGNEALIKKKDLFSIMFMLAKPEEQAKMIPVKREEMKEYERQHRVKVTKDLKAGEEVVVNCKIHVPTVIDDALHLKEPLQQESKGI